MKRTYRSSCNTWTARDDRDLHRTDCIAIAIFLHRTVDAPHNHGLLDRAIVTIQSPEAQLNGLEDSRKNSTIAVRSNHDRSVIESRSWLFHRGISATISAQGFNSKCQEKYPRLRPDRLAIVDRSPIDRDHDQERSWLRLKRNQGQISVRLRPPCRQMETTSTTLQNCSHDRFNCPRSSG